MGRQLLEEGRLETELLEGRGDPSGKVQAQDRHPSAEQQMEESEHNLPNKSKGKGPPPLDAWAALPTHQEGERGPLRLGRPVKAVPEAVML